MPKEKEEVIQSFLTSLDQGYRENFLSYVEHTYSVFEIWLYASVLGY